METGTGTSFGILAILKWLFPSLIGSALAVWYKRHDVIWVDKTFIEKVILSFIGILAIAVGCCISYAIGGAFILKLAITEDIYQWGVYLLSGLCSLKTLDAVVKNSDDIINTVVKGIKDMVKSVVSKFTGGDKSGGSK